MLTRIQSGTDEKYSDAESKTGVVIIDGGEALGYYHSFSQKYALLNSKKICASIGISEGPEIVVWIR